MYIFVLLIFLFIFVSFIISLANNLLSIVIWQSVNFIDFLVSILFFNCGLSIWYKAASNYVYIVLSIILSFIFRFVYYQA
jgi:hypothetical protein